MSILDNLRAEPTGFAMPKRARVSCDISREATGNERPSLDRNEEYALSAKLVVRFWANKAQLSDATRTAEKVLIREIYSGCFQHMAALRSAIMGGEIGRAMFICDELEKEMAP